MNGTVLVAHSPQFSRQTPVTPRCGCEDYEVSLCVAHSCFTRDVGGAREGGGGGALRQVTSVSARTETETGGQASVRGISRVRAVTEITLQQTRTIR